MSSRKRYNNCCGPVVSGPKGEPVQITGSKTTITKNGMLVIKLRNGGERVFGNKEISDYAWRDNVLHVIDTDGAVIGYYPADSLEYAEWRKAPHMEYTKIEIGVRRV